MAKIVALVLLAVIAVALLWSAGEQHYRSCIEARYYRGTSAVTGFVGGDPPKLGAISTAGCSRRPF